MDSIIPLGQKNTLAEYMILSGADNRPPMLDKDLYDSWKSRMEIYMQNKEHERMILESVENGPLIWPTVKENGVIRTKKYAELSVAEKIQADSATDLWERVQLLMQGNFEEATTVRKAITLLRQAIGSSPGENTGTTKLESTRGDSVIGCVVT
ncbi:hypothetical protein Tco_1117422 [Tanacetum coccineum]